MRQHHNILYVNGPDTSLGLRDEAVELRPKAGEPTRLPRHALGAIVCFGPVYVSPALMQACAEEGIGITFLSFHGRFMARVEGPQSGNVLLRRAQHRAADGPMALEIARSCILGKLANSRAVLRRGAREAKDAAVAEALHQAADALHASLLPARAAEDAEALRGVEGQGAALYFGALGHLFRGELSFSTRSRRPPRDEANAAMGFLYALLCADCATAAQVVGLDPQLGFFHAERSGRPSLALDLMEELRPVADRVLLALVNRRQLRAEHFVREEPGAVLLSEVGRRVVLEAWSAHRKVELHHPFLEIDTTYGLLPQLQARVLARHLRGDIDAYVPYLLG